LSHIQPVAETKRSPHEGRRIIVPIIWIPDDEQDERELLGCGDTIDEEVFERDTLAVASRADLLVLGYVAPDA
jgi:hypothetical protein